MTFHVLVAEPSNENWASITTGIKRCRPDASILRVKDGEQAARFLFFRGLFSDEPESPDLVVLAAELPFFPADAVVARMRQHARTHLTPTIVIWGSADHEDAASATKRRQWLGRHQALSIISGKDELGSEITEAVKLLCGGSAAVGDARGSGVHA